MRNLSEIIKKTEISIDYEFVSKTNIGAVVEYMLSREGGQISRERALLAENLEFLGDRVLGLGVAELLTLEYPNLPVGERAVTFNNSVGKSGCLSAAKVMRLFPAAQTGNIITAAQSVYADAAEGALASVYLDAGWDAAVEVVRKIWSPIVNEARNTCTDPRTALQEWTQAQGLGLPEYTVKQVGGSHHAPIFEAEVRIAGSESALARGESHKSAKAYAATNLLSKISE